MPESRVSAIELLCYHVRPTAWRTKLDLRHFDKVRPVTPESPTASRWVSGSVGPLLCAAVAITFATGCRPQVTRIRIQDFLDPGAPRALYQDFDEAYYHLDAADSLKLVLRREAPSRAIPTENITQIIRVETYWRPIPGTTYVESTMINAKLTYLIESGRTARLYEGNAFVSFKEDHQGEVLTGRIESANLKPAGQIGPAPTPFGQAHLEGTFRALRKPRRATAILTGMDRTLQRMNPMP